MLVFMRLVIGFLVTVTFFIPLYADRFITETVFDQPYNLQLKVFVFDGGSIWLSHSYNGISAKFYIDIATDSTFTQYVPGFKNYNHGLTTSDDRYADNYAYYSYWRYKSSLKHFSDGIYLHPSFLFNNKYDTTMINSNPLHFTGFEPGKTYYCRTRFTTEANYPLGKDTMTFIGRSLNSNTVSFTMPLETEKEPYLMPLQMLDSTSLLVRWVGKKGYKKYVVAIGEYKPAHVGGVPHFRDLSGGVVSTKEVSGNSDTIRGLKPGLITSVSVSTSANTASFTFNRVNNPAPELETFYPLHQVVNTRFFYTMPSAYNKAINPISYYQGPTPGMYSTSATYYTVRQGQTPLSSLPTSSYFYLDTFEKMVKDGIPIDTVWINHLGLNEDYTGDQDAWATLHWSFIEYVVQCRKKDDRIMNYIYKEGVSPLNAQLFDTTTPGITWKNSYYSTYSRYIPIAKPTSVWYSSVQPQPAQELFFTAPNPFSEETELLCELPKSGVVQVEVFDLTGRQQRTIYAGRYGAGRLRLPVSARGLNTGVHFVRLRLLADDGSVVQRSMPITITH